MVSFPPVSPPKPYTSPSPHPYRPHAQPISFFSILSPAQYWVRSRVETESGGTRRRTGGEVKGKEANGVGNQAGFSLTRNSPSSVTTIVLARPALQESQYSTELTPRRYKWTRPFRWKTESGFCACAITFRLHSTNGDCLQIEQKVPGNWILCSEWRPGTGEKREKMGDCGV